MGASAINELTVCTLTDCARIATPARQRVFSTRRSESTLRAYAGSIFILFADFADGVYACTGLRVYGVYVQIHNVLIDFYMISMIRHKYADSFDWIYTNPKKSTEFFLSFRILLTTF